MSIVHKSSLFGGSPASFCCICCLFIRLYFVSVFPSPPSLVSTHSARCCVCLCVFVCASALCLFSVVCFVSVMLTWFSPSISCFFQNKCSRLLTRNTPMKSRSRILVVPCHSHEHDSKGSMCQSAPILNEPTLRCIALYPYRAVIPQQSSQQGCKRSRQWSESR